MIIRTIPIRIASSFVRIRARPRRHDTQTHKAPANKHYRRRDAVRQPSRSFRQLLDRIARPGMLASLSPLV
jgi:hypothetical protein